MQKVVPKVTFVNESQLVNFNKFISEDKKCYLFDNQSEDKCYVSLFFIIKEIYEYLNVKTVDNILLSKLRNLLIECKDIEGKISSIKSFLTNIQEEQKISI